MKSTFKLGIGANVQTKLKAVHHLDVPWRPADIVINAVSYHNGQMITTGYEEMAFFCEYVAKITGQKCSLEFDNKAIKKN